MIVAFPNKTGTTSWWKNTSPLIKCSCQRFDPESDPVSGFNKHITGNEEQRNMWNGTRRIPPTRLRQREASGQTTRFVHQINCKDWKRVAFTWTLVWAESKTNETKTKAEEIWTLTGYFTLLKICYSILGVIVVLFSCFYKVLQEGPEGFLGELEAF